MSIDPDSSTEVRNNKFPWRAWLRAGTGWLVLLTAVVLALRPIGPSAPVSASNVPAPAVERRNPHIGPLDAPVTMVEFGDFACPACRVWNDSEILKKVLDKYGDKVRFVWADFPSITLELPKAAEAARCAYDQNKFWEYHDYLYFHMESLGINDLKLYASVLNLDRTQFDTCLDTGARKAEILNDFRDAMYRQVGVLPTFYVNEIRLAGPPSFELLVSVIDPLLAEKP